MGASLLAMAKSIYYLFLLSFLCKGDVTLFWLGFPILLLYYFSQRKETWNSKLWWREESEKFSLS